MTEPTAPYTNTELMHMAIEGKPLDPLRTLATYANSSNWYQVTAVGVDGKPRNYWAWRGPTIVGYELAQNRMDDSSTRTDERRKVLSELLADGGDIPSICFRHPMFRETGVTG